MGAWVCHASFAENGDCIATANQDYTSVVHHDFRFSPTCASAVVETYGPVYIATVLLQVCVCVAVTVAVAVAVAIDELSWIALLTGLLYMCLPTLQCMSWAAWYIGSDTPLLRRWCRHTGARLSCRSPNTVVVGGHGVPMYLAYSCVSTWWLCGCGCVAVWLYLCGRHLLRTTFTR